MASTPAPQRKLKLNQPHITAPLLVLFSFVAMHLSRYMLKGSENVSDLFLNAALVQILVMILPCMLYYLLKKRTLATPMPAVAIKGRHVALTLFGGCLLISGNLLIKFLYRLTSSQTADSSVFFAELSGKNGEVSPVGIFLALVIVPAVCEEVLFRGILLSEYRSLGEGNAVVISALCFAMLHFSVTGFPIYLFSGLLLGVVAASSRSILPSILLHLLSNALSLYTSDQFLSIIMDRNGAFFVGFLLTMIFGAFLFLFLYCLEHQYLRFAQEPPVQSLPPKNRTHLHRVFLSPAFLLLCAVFFIITAFR
jgi:membrane protease YdiL (CAAX protease family)